MIPNFLTNKLWVLRVFSTIAATSANTNWLSGVQKGLTMYKRCLKQLVLQWIQLHKCDSVPAPLFKNNWPEQLTQPVYKTLPVQRAHLPYLMSWFCCFLLSTLKQFLQGKPLLIGYHPPPCWKLWDLCTWLQQYVEPLIIPVQILVPRNSPPPAAVFIFCWKPSSPTLFLGRDFPTLHSWEFQPLEQ